ncbi:MAG: hypothetical protein WAM60_12740 [Candidatus Promineifilaceae bacterium]
MDGKRFLKQLLSYWPWWLACALHLGGLILYLDLNQVFYNPPVADTDYALHWAEVWNVSHYLDDGRLWGYDPHFMAGYAEGTLLDIDNKLIEVSSWLVSKSGVSLPLSYNLVLLAMTLLSPLAIYPAVRWLTSNHTDAFISQLAVLALWYFDPTLRWNWLGGTLAFISSVLLSLLLMGAAVRLAEKRMTNASWLVWWLLGPLLFWVHALAFVLLCLPLFWLVLRGRHTFSRQQWLAFLLWPLLVIFVNLPWLVTAVQFAGTKASSNQFLQGGLPALAGDLLGLGRVDGASTVSLLGLRWLTLSIGGVGLWRLARQRKAVEPVLLGAWFGLALAYGGLYLPGGGNLQPYRYIDQAMIWSSVGLGTGLRALWAKIKNNESRWPNLQRAFSLVVIVLISLWVLRAAVLFRPPQLGGPPFNRWQGPSEELMAMCDYVQTLMPLDGRLLTDDARVGTLLPWCSAVEVIGGPFFFIWTDYGYTNANIWTFLDVPYPDYTPESWRQALQTYNVEWLIVNTGWGVPEWHTMSEWLARHPEEVEPGPKFGIYQFYKVNGYQPEAQPTITAEQNVLRIQNAEPGLATRLPYHWIPPLSVWPPDGAVLQSETVGSDPIPFIVVIPNQEEFLICDPIGCPER